MYPVLGHNPLVSGPDGELSISVKRALDKGALGIAVDPRRSETGKYCQQWLPIRPGTDAAPCPCDDTCYYQRKHLRCRVCRKVDYRF